MPTPDAKAAAHLAHHGASRGLSQAELTDLLLPALRAWEDPQRAAQTLAGCALAGDRIATLVQVARRAA